MPQLPKYEVISVKFESSVLNTNWKSQKKTCVKLFLPELLHHVKSDHKKRYAAELKRLDQNQKALQINALPEGTMRALSGLRKAAAVFVCR